MKVFLIVLLCVLAGNSRQVSSYATHTVGTGNFLCSSSKKVSIAFTGTVKSIETLGERKLLVIPVDPDSRFAITIHIEAVSPDAVPLKAGTDQVFAVHSPAMLFQLGEADIIGKKFRFKIAWKGTDNESRFSNLTVAAIVDEDPKRIVRRRGDPQ